MSDQLKDFLKSSGYFFISIYAVSVGILYEWGYWGRFDINILQFMSASEVLRSAAYPFLGVFVFFILGAGLNLFLFKPLPEGGGRTTKVGVILNKHSHFYAIAAICTLVFINWLSSGRWAWDILGFAVWITCTVLISRLELLHSLIPDDEIRALVGTFVVAMPVFSFTYGATAGEEILSGSDYREATIPSTIEKSKFLGIAGDYAFFLSLDNQRIYIRRNAEIPNIVIVHRKPMPGN